MTTIETQAVDINAPIEKVFNFLTDFNNYKALMPPEIQDFSATQNKCTFNIKGMAEVSLMIIEKQPFEKITIISKNDNLFDFDLYMLLKKLSANQCSGKILFQSHNMNFAMQMVAKKPLEHFFSSMVEAVKKHFETNS